MDIWRLNAAGRVTAAAGVVLAIARPAVAATPAFNVDCNCVIVGRYVLPASTLAALPASGATGSSPLGKYVVTAQPGLLQPAAIMVKRADDGAVLISDEEAADWGFSPDDDRFVVAKEAVGGAPAVVLLFDLTQVPATNLAQLNPSTAGSAISFSPHGVYLIDVELTPSPNAVALQALDARSGSVQFSDAFTFTAGPGQPEDELGAVAVGFGPDALDRTLTYAYITGSTASQWTAVNLQTKTRVVDQQPGAAFVWGFSPCGDAIGIVDDHEPAALKDAVVFETLEPHQLGSSGTFPATDTGALSVDLNNHLLTHASIVEPIAANTSSQACPSPPPNNPPTAAFTAPATSLALLAVQFTDHSADSDGRVVAFSWDFGDGQFSTLRSPTHVFLAAGTFTVKLTVTDDGGAQDSVSHAIEITANQPPHAAFSFVPAAPAIHEIVTFTDQSTDDDGIVTEDWSIDNVHYSGPVVQAKACPPSMNAILDVTDHGGQGGEATETIPVTGSTGDVHVAAGADLAAAIAAACPGDRLVLDAGHYTGGIRVPATISIKGAGMGATFIDGYGSDPGSWVLQVESGATISDLTVTAGGTASPSAAGGGILVLGRFPNVDPAVFAAVELTGNHGFGAMTINDQVALVTISGARIHDNSAETPGTATAISMGCCAAVFVDHTEVAHNTGGSSAISIWESSGLSFVANDVHDNDGVGLATQVVAGPAGTPREVLLSRFAANGAGVQVDLELTFAGNLVVGNRGFGLNAGHAGEVTVVNSTIADNTGAGLGNGIVVYNTIAAGNGTDLDGTLGGGGNNLIGVAPGFVGPGDYHLAPGSPAIDRGDNSAVPASLVVDADGDPRILNGGSGSATVDIGWDEALSGFVEITDAGTDAGPASDAGTGADAGSDAGVESDAGSPSDAGVESDAGSPSDAGVVSDAGNPSDAGSGNDAGSLADAGSSGPPQSGCGCRTGSPGGAVMWLAAVAFFFSRRRRRACR